MYKNGIKRIIDFVLSLIGLVVLSPVFIIVTILLYFANRGAGVFFTQERPGKEGRIFKVIKFKSMTDERDENGELLSNEERITRVGAFIRSTSLDEIPQLINVLKGDMALIGPRPLLVEYLPYYTNRERRRHNVRPGITGLAQISGRNNLTWERRLNLDVEYVENISFKLDCEILYKTLYKVLKREDIIVTLDPEKNTPLNVYRENKIKKT